MSNGLEMNDPSISIKVETLLDPLPKALLNVFHNNLLSFII